MWKMQDGKFECGGLRGGEEETNWKINFQKNRTNIQYRSAVNTKKGGRGTWDKQQSKGGGGLLDILSAYPARVAQQVSPSVPISSSSYENRTII
jgi:hypothetical protein